MIVVGVHVDEVLRRVCQIDKVVIVVVIVVVGCPPPLLARTAR